MDTAVENRDIVEICASLNGFLSDLFSVVENWQYLWPRQMGTFKKETASEGLPILLLLLVLYLGKVHVGLFWEQDQ